MADVENVIIVGSGPAGYTGLCTRRAESEPAGWLEGFAWGGLAAADDRRVRTTRASRRGSWARR